MNLGDLVGARFRVDREVGAGGMGVVYRALDLETQRPVALKVFTWRDAVEVERALREVQVLARLHHPAIVRHVGDGVTDDGQLYLAMDWIEGTTVADRLAAEGLTAADAVALARPVASALAFAHDEGVLHRDIKPSNVVLEGDVPATALLIDFGIARLLDTVGSLTKTGTTIGTPGYMSPEQARGVRELTPAVDVFGLGCLLYECVTGRPAFTGANGASVMASILFAEPIAVRELCPEAPPELVTLIERMLKKSIVARIASCATVHQLLADLPPIPAGPRRNSLGFAVTIAPPSTDSLFHCMVGAAQGALDDVLDPPSPEACMQLARAATGHDAALEVLASGSVVAHLTGQPELTATRAASLALAMREIIPSWAIVISSTSTDTGSLFDTGTQMLNGAAMAAIFRRGPEALQIRIDQDIATLLGDEFDVAPGKQPRLIGRKRA